MKFYILDVFARHRFEGNQLAVFMAPEGLSGDEMQSIAREINFSESAFILRIDESSNEASVRIFTPRTEVDFAGHPVIGAAHVLRTFMGADRGGVTLNLRVGAVDVTYSADVSAPFWVQTVEPEFGQTVPSADMAAILQIEERDIVQSLPVEAVSTGLPHFIVPLTGKRALAACAVNQPAYRKLVKRTSVTNLLVYTAEPHENGQAYSVRMFAEAIGIPEDPATGSGNTCLAAYLMRNVKPDEDRLEFRTGQGYEMGRPSELHLIAQRNGTGCSIQLGGNVVEIAAGEWGRS